MPFHPFFPSSKSLQMDCFLASYRIHAADFSPGFKDKRLYINILKYRAIKTPYVHLMISSLCSASKDKVAWLFFCQKWLFFKSFESSFQFKSNIHLQGVLKMLVNKPCHFRISDHRGKYNQLSSVLFARTDDFLKLISLWKTTRGATS